MSIIQNLTPYKGLEKTTLAGVVESDCTYEVMEHMLILRTTASDTIHITPEIGKQLIKLITDQLL